MIQRYVKRRIQSDWGNLALLSDVGDLPLTVNKLLFYFCTSWGDWVRYVHVNTRFRVLAHRRNGRIDNRALHRRRSVGFLACRSGMGIYAFQPVKKSDHLDHKTQNDLRNHSYTC